MNTLALQPTTLVPIEFEDAFSRFLGLNVANGDASPLTVAHYRRQIGYFYDWCQGQGINAARASEDDIISYRSHLIEHGDARNTIVSKLNAVRRFFAAAVWRALRPDNPAAAVRPPSTTATKCRPPRRTEVSRLNPEALV